MDTTLVRLFEHNDWANARLLEACSALGDGPLDAPPETGSTWSLRRILAHLVEAQQGYLSLLTSPPEDRREVHLSFAELQASARASGAALLALARDEEGLGRKPRLRTTDGFLVEPWVVMVQVIQHATEHRRQSCDRLRALGLTPPRLDGWSFGESVHALVPVSS